MNRKHCVEDALAGPLLAQGETEKAAKRLIESSVERAYYRARFRKTLDAFREQRWGR